MTRSWFVFVVLVLAACATPVKQESSVTLLEKMPIDGIWEGSFDINGKGPYDFHAIHVDGRSTAVSHKAKAMCAGKVEGKDGDYYAHYQLYSLDGSPFDSARITGTFADGAIESYFVTLNGGDIGALKMKYNPLYEQDASIDSLSGQWSFTDRDGLVLNMSILDGQMTGVDSDQCTYSGQLAVINPNYNAYALTLTIADCDSVNGEYHGMGYLDQEEKPLFRIDIVNERYGFHFDLQEIGDTGLKPDRPQT